MVDWMEASEMAARIIELVENPDKRNAMGLKGQQKKREKFSVNAMVLNVEKVFEELLS